MLDDKGKFHSLAASNAVYSPKLRNLLSSGIFEKQRHRVVLEEEHSHILLNPNPGERITDEGKCHLIPLRCVGHLRYLDYLVPIQASQEPEADFALSARSERACNMEDITPTAVGSQYITSKTDVHVNLPDVRDPYYLMHRRLAHIGNTVYDTTVAAVEGLPKRGHHKSGCPCCALGKSTVKRHARDATLKRASKPLAKLHLDLMGKFNSMSLGGAYYALVIVDDFTRYTEVFTLQRKTADAVLEKLKIFLAQLSPQGQMPETIMTDWGTEFQGSFEQFCVDKQIQIVHSCPYSAWQNGLVERANRTLSRLARTMMIDSQLPPEFWGHALDHAAFISNRVCHSGKTQTPFQGMFKEKPDLRDLRVWGCPGAVHIQNDFVPKNLAHWHAEPGIFLGYCSRSPSYRFYLPNSRRVVSRRDAVFFEDRPGVQVGLTKLLPVGDRVAAPALSLPGFAHYRHLEDVDLPQSQSSSTPADVPTDPLVKADEAKNETQMEHAIVPPSLPSFVTTAGTVGATGLGSGPVGEYQAAKRPDAVYNKPVVGSKPLQSESLDAFLRSVNAPPSQAAAHHLPGVFSKLNVTDGRFTWLSPTTAAADLRQAVGERIKKGSSDNDDFVLDFGS